MLRDPPKYRLRWYHVPEDFILLQHSCEHAKCSVYRRYALSLFPPSLTAGLCSVQVINTTFHVLFQLHSTKFFSLKLKKRNLY